MSSGRDFSVEHPFFNVEREGNLTSFGTAEAVIITGLRLTHSAGNLAYAFAFTVAMTVGAAFP